MSNLYLIRGLPGAGKDTLAETLNIDHVFSADQYFEDDGGNYSFNARKLKDAHQFCRRNTEVAMQNNKTNIAVTNTFTQWWEMEPYFELAKAYGYRIFSLICESRHKGTNVHDVPQDIIQKMENRFEVVL